MAPQSAKKPSATPSSASKRTPAAKTPTLQKQSSIVSFFKKPSNIEVEEDEDELPTPRPARTNTNSRATPAFSSDAAGPRTSPTPLVKETGNLHIQSVESRRNESNGKSTQPKASSSQTVAAASSPLIRNVSCKSNQDHGFPRQVNEV